METTKNTSSNSKICARQPLMDLSNKLGNKRWNTLKNLLQWAENIHFLSPIICFVVSKLRQSKLIGRSNKLINILEKYNARIQLSLAFSFLTQGCLEKAIDVIEAVIKIMPEYAPAYHAFAECYFCKNNQQKSLAMLRTAIKLSPQYIEAHFTLGYVLYKGRQLEEAKASFKNALLLKSDYAEALNYLGMVYQEEEQPIEAEKMYRQAIEIKPDYADAYNNLGFLLRQLNRSVEAAANFRIAHALAVPSYAITSVKAGATYKKKFARRYLRIYFDILRWSIGCGLRPNAWLDYILLNQETNGASSDHFSKMIKVLFSSRKSRQTPKWRSSPVLPSIKQEDMPTIIDALNKDGIYVFDQLIDASLLDEIQKYALTAEARLTAYPVTSKTRSVKLRAQFKPNALLANGYNFDESDLMMQPLFQKFAGDPLFLAIAQEYFGVEPKLTEVLCWWSTIFARNPTSDMAQLYHNDLAHIKWLAVFVYVTDVTINTGPHSLVRGSHKPDKEGKNLRRRGFVRVSDEDIHSAFGRERIVNVVGPRGTVFIADTRAFHKGQHPLMDNRLLLQWRFANSVYPEIGKKDWTLSPKDPVLIETIMRHPKMFARYKINKDK